MCLRVLKQCLCVYDDYSMEEWIKLFQKDKFYYESGCVFDNNMKEEILIWRNNINIKI